MNINFRDREGTTILESAIENGHSAVAQLLLLRGDVDVNSGTRIFTPLTHAIWKSNDTIVRLLLECHDIDPNKGTFGDTPLTSAAVEGNMEIVRLLLQRPDIDPNKKDLAGRTPLWYATTKGHDHIVELLLSREDVNPNAIGDNDKPPFIVAVCKGNETIVRLFLARNDIDPNLNGINGITPLWRAARSRHNTIVQLLLERTDVDPNPRTAIFTDSSPFRPPFHTGLRGGETPLCVATRKGNEATVKLLLDHYRVDPNMVDGNRCSPLWWAAIKNHPNIVRLLLCHPAIIPSLRHNESSVPLSAATQWRYEVTIELLLNPNTADEKRWTPLLRAAMEGNKIIVEYLLEHAEINPNSNLRCISRSETPFMLTHECRRNEIARLLAALEGTS